jgi:hypothetical protein
MASTIFFNGRVTSIPGSYSQVDTSGLASVGLGAAGIVAVIGEAEGGEPQKVESVSNPAKTSRLYRDGDLREAGNIVFDPSKDPNIQAGAQTVKYVKVNPATQSLATLVDDVAADSIDLTSRDYGLFTTRINVDIADGTNIGKSIVVVFDATTETFDDVGGLSLLTLTYTPGANGATTMTAALDNDVDTEAAWTLDTLGLDGDITTPIVATDTVSVVSDNVADNTQTITIYGTDVTDAPQTEVLALDGTTPVAGTATWNSVLGVLLSASAAGTVTLSDVETPGTILTVVTTVLSMGLKLVDNVATALDGADYFDFVGDMVSATPIAFFGVNGQASAAIAATTLPSSPQSVTTAFSEITVIGLGATPAARTVTTTGKAFKLPVGQYTTVNEVADAIKPLSGWTVVVGANAGLIPVSDMDDQAATDVTSALEFYGDLAAVIAKLNDESQLVSAAKATGATAAPANTASPVYLTGGVEGATAFSDWQAALDLLRDEFVNTIVPLTDDPAVHAAAVSHCAYMAGAGRKERDTILGLPTGTTFTAAKAAAVALNTRHARLLPQDMVRFNVDGVSEQFPPYFHALVAAGQQAGSSVGTSLTYKFTNVLDVVGDDATYVLQDDADELIQSGLLVQEKVQGVGFRWLRNITTYLIDNNPAFTEAAVNEAANFSAFNIRTNLEFAIGRKGFAGTVNAMIDNVVTTLGLLSDPLDPVITEWRNLTIELTGDTATVEVEIAPVQSINFIKTTLHLVQGTITAAA